jgi:hypothetical protein
MAAITGMNLFSILSPFFLACSAVALGGGPDAIKWPDEKGDSGTLLWKNDDKYSIL